MLNQIDLSRTDLNLLVLFETVMREGHVGRAAERLNLTASAVSHGLKRLRALLNDPLFLKTPRGVVPTDRAIAIAPLVTEVLAQVRAIVGTAEPFDPARTHRRFAIAAPDGVSSVFLPALISRLATEAPGASISLRQLLPHPDEPRPEIAWRDVFAALDAREMDLAVVPIDAIPARFSARMLFKEQFVIAMRRGHPLEGRLDLAAYCSAAHLVVSASGDPYGFVDTALAERGLSRRVALTVPNFAFALSVVAGSDLIAALPAGHVAMHAERYGLITAPSPITLPSYNLNLVASRAALMDEGLAWMAAQLAEAASSAPLPALRLPWQSGRRRS